MSTINQSTQLIVKIENILTHMNFRGLEEKYLISNKFLYLILSVQFYTLHQFRSIFASEKFEIAKSTLGYLMGLMLFLTFFTNVGIAAMNDFFNKPKTLLVTLIVSSCLVFQIFYYDTFTKNGAYIFWIVMFLYLMTNTSIIPIFDKITMDYLNKIPGIDPKRYGRQRLWGTIGYLIANLLVESLVVFEVDKKKVYKWGLLRVFQLISTLIATVSVLFLIKNAEISSSNNRVLAGFKDLIRNFHYMFFIFIIVLNGVCRASMTTYLTIYQSKVLNLKGYQNLPVYLKMFSIFNSLPLFTCSFFGVIVEILLFFYSENILNKLGLHWPLLLAQVGGLFRFVLYYFLPPTHSHVFLYSCSFELLKGVNFGLTHMSGVQLAKKLCPPDIASSGQMIYNGSFVGIASFLSGIIFGSLFKTESMEKEKDMGSKISSFKTFFIYNILLTLIAIGLFVLKYGVSDRTLAVLPWKGADLEKKIAETKKKDELLKKEVSINDEQVV